ncbi:MAG: cell filamentation protein Fic [Novosphingobium sp.]|nr:cell filamentation protein Fic [Novosphingobium sp.]
MLTPRHAPDSDLSGHLTFALRYEGLNLPVLAKLFRTVAPADIAAIVEASPTGSYARRIWFLYELLTGRGSNYPMRARCARSLWWIPTSNTLWRRESHPRATG